MSFPAPEYSSDQEPMKDEECGGAYVFHEEDDEKPVAAAAAATNSRLWAILMSILLFLNLALSVYMTIAVPHDYTREIDACLAHGRSVHSVDDNWMGGFTFAETANRRQCLVRMMDYFQVSVFNKLFLPLNVYCLVVAVLPFTGLVDYDA